MNTRWKIFGGLGLIVFLGIGSVVLKKEYARPMVVERDAMDTGQPSVIPNDETTQETSVDSVGNEESMPLVEHEQSTKDVSDTQSVLMKKETISELSTTKTSSSFSIVDRLVSFGFGTANRKAKDIDTVVLHSSYNNQGGDVYSVDKVIGIWKSYGVAPHYLIDRKGNVYRLVAEHNIAYHAGVSEMKDGRKNVNNFSLGVEILNTETEEYTDAQYSAVKNLISYLKKTYPIQYVVGHDDIAPGRKTDPWNFDWKRIR